MTSTDDCNIDSILSLMGGTIFHFIVGIKIMWGNIAPYIVSYKKWRYDDDLCAFMILDSHIHCTLPSLIKCTTTLPDILSCSIRSRSIIPRHSASIYKCFYWSITLHVPWRTTREEDWCTSNCVHWCNSHFWMYVSIVILQNIAQLDLLSITCGYGYRPFV